MSLGKMALYGIGAYLLYEYLKLNNPTVLTSIGLSGSSGMGRVYLSGMRTIGQGYNINSQTGGDASHYEKATKFLM